MTWRAGWITSVMLLSERCLTIPTMSSSFLSPVTRDLEINLCRPEDREVSWLLEGATVGKGEVLGQSS